MKLTATRSDEASDFIPVNDLFRSRRSHDNRNRDRFGQVFEKGPEWGDTDPGADKYGPIRRAGVVVGERPVGALDGNAGSWCELGHGTALIADALTFARSE